MIPEIKIFVVTETIRLEVSEKRKKRSLTCFLILFRKNFPTFSLLLRPELFFMKCHQAAALQDHKSWLLVTFYLFLFCLCCRIFLKLRKQNFGFGFSLCATVSKFRLLIFGPLSAIQIRRCRKNISLTHAHTHTFLFSLSLSLSVTHSLFHLFLSFSFFLFPSSCLSLTLSGYLIISLILIHALTFPFSLSHYFILSQSLSFCFPPYLSPYFILYL